MSAFAGPDIVTNGLVMHLDAANIYSYPRTGNTWFDISANRNNGTFYNSPSFSNENNGCIVLINPGANVNCNGFTFNQPNLTYNCWFKGNAIGSDHMHFISKELVCKYRTANNSSELEVLISTNGTSWTNTFTAPTQNLIKSGTWNNVTITVQSNGPVVIYLNGILRASGTLAGTLGNNNNVINIGSWDIAGYNTFNGSIAAAQVYNRSLSNKEVLQNYNALKGRFKLS